MVDTDNVDRQPEAGPVSSAARAGAATDSGSGRGDRRKIARSRITVVIADDQPLMRSALRMCLSPELDIEVVGEASDGEEAVALANRLRPDVVIMDIRMPVLDGVAATQRLTTGRDDPLRVLIITAFELDEYIVEALRLGASGFLVKDAEPAELVHAIRVIAAGDAVLAPRITKRLLDLVGHQLPPPRLASPMPTQLTTREQTVLQLIAEGRSNREIGRTLFLADSTVKSHVGHLLAKLGLTDRIHLVIFAYNNGMLRPATSATPCTKRHPPDHANGTYASVSSPHWTNGSPSATP
jgi:DNA-binding NarL/FixJ family response regulator